MGIIAWMLLGLVAAAVVRFVHPAGSEPSGLFGALIVGALGAMLGGLIASAAGIGEISSFFSLGAWLFAIGGALLLVTVFNAVAGSRGHTRSA